MKKNEVEFFNKANRMQNNFGEIKYRKSKTNTVEKYNFSRDSFLKYKNKTTSNFNLYKNSLISNNSSKDISNKNEELIKSDINSFFNKKSELINIKHKKNSSKSCYNKNKSNISNWFNKTQIKKKKIDFIKYKFLLGQKNYYKSFQDNFNFSSYYSKKINPYVRKNPKIFYIHIDKLNKLFLGKDKKNIYSIKDLGDNLFISLSKHFNNNQNRKIVSKINNCINIKIKKYNSINTLKFPNESLFEDKDIIRSKNNNNIIEKPMKNKNIKNQQTDFKQEDDNKSKNNNNDIIDDNYKEYLKDITSAESNKNKSERKNINRKNPKLMIKNLKQIKFEIPLNDKNEIFQYKKRLNKYNYSNMLIKNNKKLFEFKKFVTNRKKSLDDINRSISKSIIIENLVFGKKIMLDKSTNK